MQPDYARLLGMFARDLVNAPACRPAALPAKVCGYLNASLRPLLLDPGLLGTSAVAANVHACAAYAAIKMHCCLRSMRERGAAGRRPCRSTQTSDRSGGALDFSRLAMVVLESVRGYIVRTCMRCSAALLDPLPPPDSVSGLPHNASDLRTDARSAAGAYTHDHATRDTSPALGAADLELLTLSAFRKVLLRKHASYGGALAEIECALRARRLRRRAAVWEHVTAPRDRLPAALRGIEW